MGPHEAKFDMRHGDWLTEARAYVANASPVIGWSSFILVGSVASAGSFTDLGPTPFVLVHGTSPHHVFLTQRSDLCAWLEFSEGVRHVVAKKKQQAAAIDAVMARD